MNLLTLNFKWSKEPPRALGTYIYHTMRNKTMNLILEEKCKNLTTFLAYGTLGPSRNLTLFGKCFTTKSLGISQLVHPLSTLDFPTQLVQAVKSSIFKFWGEKRRDKIKCKIMAQDYNKSGLRAPKKDTF